MTFAFQFQPRPHTYLVDAHKDTTDKVGNNADQDGGDGRVLHILRAHVAEPDEGAKARDGYDDQAAEENDKVANRVDNRHPQRVADQEGEGCPCRLAETEAIDGNFNVGVAVEELETLLHAPEADGAALEDNFGHGTQAALGLFLDVRKNDADHLHHGNDEGAKGERAKVVPGGGGGGGVVVWNLSGPRDAMRSVVFSPLRT
jgi:hypothetical protein